MTNKTKTLLAFDTCFQACSVAVIGRQGSLCSRYEEMERGHAERLVPMVSSVMTEAGISFAGLDGIATTVGPGTFTGTRIGIATARGFALSLDRPVFGVPSLTVMARKAQHLLETDEHQQLIVVAINARREQIYAQAFGTNVPEVLWQPALMSPTEAAQSLVGTRAIAVGSAAQMLSEAANACGVSCDPQLENLQPDASFIEHKDLQEHDVLSPLYLRPPDAKPPIGKTIARASS